MPTEGEDPLTAEAARMPGFNIDGQERPRRADVPHERFHVTLGDAPARGPVDAPVTLVAYSDFECPYCEQGHATLKELMREYKGELRVVYKAFPLSFHRHAMIAALAARSAQSQGKFWEFHDLLLSQRGLSMERILEYAREVNLDLDAMARDIDALKYGVAIRREMREARRLGVRGTPAYFINGRMLSGARPIAEYREIIDQELKLAAKWRASGVAAADVYAYAIADGYRAVEYEEGGDDLDPDAVYDVPVGDSPRRGPDDALVTIVEFADFECPFCARGHAVLERIRQRHGDRVRVVFKHLPLPFHSHAYLAARASMAAMTQGKFWAFHDAVY
ncbi:MAG: thioredoxin domain-containing protein, partial [Myxococcales bacterium]|nr:thioredoxin domain-containing protein [Myxococcales bacterium]